MSDLDTHAPSSDPTLPLPDPALPAFWARAFAQAARSIGLSEPNPRVGCVLTDASGRVLGEGHTQQAGGPHAEVMALRDAAQRGESVRGATAWVTLEPCAHHGRTPPCCDALIAAGLGAVRAASVDPFKAVAGQGLARLRAAGLDVRLADEPAVRAAALALNPGFFSRIVRGRPWVRLKAAVSLDGRSALPNGASQWITGPEARHDGHAFRRRAGAVLTGVGTVLEDDPRLDVRGWPTTVQPVRVVVDSALRTPPAARLLQPPGRVWIAHAQIPQTGAGVDAPGESGGPGPLGAAERLSAASALLAAGAELIPLTAPGGKTDLAALLAALAERGVNELHLEAGEKLNASFLRAGLVDELLVYQAPRLLGAGAGLAALGPWAQLSDTLDFERLEHRAVGADLRLRLQRPGAADALLAALAGP